MFPVKVCYITLFLTYKYSKFPNKIRFFTAKVEKMLLYNSAPKLTKLPQNAQKSGVNIVEALL